jgi:RecB family exonuclease
VLGREDTLAVLGSRYVDGVPGLAAAARAAGVRDLGKKSRARVARRPFAAPLVERAEKLLAVIEAMPREGTLATHAAALGNALAGLGVPRRARALVDGAEGARDTDDLRLLAAVARDQAAMDAVDDVLASLPRAALRLGIDKRVVSRREFADLLDDLAGATPLRRIGARGGAIKLVPLAELAGRRFDHVFVPGLVDGQAPARGGDDGVWGERERRALNKALGARIVAESPGDAADGERTPWENLLLAGALAAARHGVIFSFARSANARAQTRSPFLDELLRAAPGVRVEELAASPIPSPDQARAPADLLARAVLESFAEPGLRLPGPRASDDEARSLYAAAQQALPARLRRVAALAGIERERWSFFARRAEPGRFVGAVGASPALDRRAGGHAAQPMSASQIEDLARCPWSFFARRVLAVGELDEADLSPERRKLGSVAHAVLERFYTRRAAAGALPIADDLASRTELDACIDEVFAENQDAPGHPTLWAIARERMREELVRLVEHEAAANAADRERAVPAFFELEFGGPHPGGLPALEIGGLVLGGRVDRVDVLPQGKGVVVVDYKLGRKTTQDKKMAAEDIGVTQLQLPLYALAVQRGLIASGRLVPGATADAQFISLRDGQPTRTLAEKLAGQENLTALLEKDLPGRLAQLGTSLRAGRLPVEPGKDACKQCDFRATCRVVVLEEEDE